MFKPRWSYLSNPFDNVTRNSFRTMRLLATDHFDKLAQAAKSDPKIEELYQFGKPYYDDFINAMQTNTNSEAFYKMYTQRMRDLLDKLSGTLARRWDVAVLNEYDNVTPEYQALFPKGRNAFQSGAYDERIDHVLALAERLEVFPNLSTLQNEVAEFGKKLRLTRNEQQGYEHNNQNASDLMEEKRYALAEALYAIYGGLIRIFFKDLRKVENFYELKYFVRSIKKATAEGELKDAIVVKLPTDGSAVKPLKESLEADTEVRITNSGSVPIQAYAEGLEKEAFEIAAGLSGVLVFEEKDGVLVLKNLDTELEGEAVVEVL